MKLSELQTAVKKLSNLSRALVVSESGKIYKKASDYLMEKDPKTFLELILSSESYDIEYNNNSFTIYLRGSTGALEKSFIPWCELDNVLGVESLLLYLDERIDFIKSEEENNKTLSKEEIDNIKRYFDCWINPLINYK